MQFDANTEYPGEEDFRAALIASLGSAVSGDPDAWIHAEAWAISKLLAYLQAVAGLATSEAVPTSAIYTLDNWAHRLGTYRKFGESDANLQTRLGIIYRLPRAATVANMQSLSNEVSGQSVIVENATTGVLPSDLSEEYMGGWHSSRCLITADCADDTKINEVGEALDRVAPAWAKISVVESIGFVLDESEMDITAFGS